MRRQAPGGVQRVMMEWLSDLVSLDRYDRPWCLWIGLLCVLLWWASRKSLAGLGPIRSKLCMATRCVVIMLLVLALAGTHKILKSEDLNVLFLLDISRSVPTQVRQTAESFLVDACKAVKNKDRVSVLTFDGQTNIEQLPTQALQVLTPLPDGERPDQTNIAQGIRMAIACAAEGMNNRVVVVSDGNQNVGDAVEEARTALANDITIDVMPLRYERGAEVVFEQLRAPPYAHLHEQVPLNLILRSDKATQGEILVYQRAGGNETLIDLDPENPQRSGQAVTLKAGKNPFRLRLPIEAERAHEFRAEFVPADTQADRLAENNTARAFTNVEGPQTVLFIGSENDREDDEILIEALIKEEIRVHAVLAESMTLSAAQLQDYSAVILSNVGADQFTAVQQNTLAAYVRDLGGGLVMIGGDDSFGAGGWQGSVVEDVMPVRFDVDAVRQIPRGALAIVMHSCEMPQGNQWGVETAKAALKTLSRMDYYGVVGWGMNGYHWEVPMQVASNKDGIIRKLNNMQNADMFDYQTPVSMAYKALMNCKDAAQRHMIIISDGDASPVSNGLLNRMRGHKVTCSTISIFPHGGTHPPALRKMAEVTGGRYWSLSKPGDEQQLPKIFIKEAKIVRRPLLRDEIFTPKVRSNLSDLMIGIDGPFPQLKGYVVTTPRQVSDVEIPLVTKRGDPLLAHWLCGFGRTVAFTSGRWKHWGSEWAGWPKFSKLWAQTVRWCMQQGSAANYEVVTSVDGEQGHIVIESMGESNLSEFREFRGRLIDPDGNGQQLAIVQTGPGRYEGRFKVTRKGTYLVNVQAPGSKKKKATMIRTGVSVAYSPEYRDLTVNESLLVEVADAANGRVLRPTVPGEEVFAHNLPPTRSRKPIWDTLLKLAIIAFLLDVAFRRIAIDPVKIAAATRAHIASLAGRFGAGRRAEATLSDLRSVRERVRSDRTAEGDKRGLSVPPPTPQDLPSAPTTSARFDAGDQATAKPAKDLAEAMGAAGEAPPQPDAKSKKKDDQPQESTTARLLKARRRRDHDENQ